ncbi:hypothetical protein BKA64DRAFT_585249, partial [Cadophora sp. MPI-SDFR-AT-0126]
RLLIFDSYSSYITYKFISRYEQLNIVPFYLITHSTYATQLLDVAYFQSKKH